MDVALIFTLVTIFIALNTSYGIKWLALGREHITWDSRTRTVHCRNLRRAYGLPRGQAKVCRTAHDVMPFVAKAGLQTLEVCQQLFEDRRWNCSTAAFAPHFSPDLTTGTREQAIVYALSSASLAHVLSKACASGGLFNCSCAAHPREATNSNFKWGGCGDNIRWAVQFTKQFTDGSEKKLVRGKSPGKRKRGSIIVPTPDLDVVVVGVGGPLRLHSKTQLAVINLQNNKAGRKMVEASVRTQCKCHGVSGSCTIKVCWKGLPKFHEIGDKLKHKYSTAIEVSVKISEMNSSLAPVRASLRYPKGDDLVYGTKSPDYCLRDDRTGSLGTRKRSCNATSNLYDSCDVMCCGRGYTTVTVQKIEMCHCKFQWCCKVICSKCLNWVDTHICN